MVACFASRIVRWVQFPHGPPNSPVAYARSIRSAENGESSVQLAGLAPSGNGVLRCIRALGARGLSSILKFPDQRFERPCQRGLMAFATNEVYAGSNPAGRSKIVLQ